MRIQGSAGSYTGASAVGNSSRYGAIKFYGYGAGTGLGGFGDATAGMAVESTEAFVAGTAHGTSLNFYTSPNTSVLYFQKRMTIGQDGFVGLGIATPLHLLDLVADDAGKPTTNTWTITSDARINTDIVDTEEALPIINALKPRRYKYTKDHVDYHDQLVSDGKASTNPYCAEKSHYGFIADEVEEVLPSCVSVSNKCSGDNESLKVLNTHNINILLVKAIQELSLANAALVSEVDGLIADIAAIKAKIGA